MKDKLEKVTDITQLKPGDKIISIGVTSENALTTSPKNSPHGKVTPQLTA